MILPASKVRSCRGPSAGRSPTRVRTELRGDPVSGGRAAARARAVRARGGGRVAGAGIRRSWGGCGGGAGRRPAQQADRRAGGSGHDARFRRPASHPEPGRAAHRALRAGGDHRDRRRLLPRPAADPLAGDRLGPRAAGGVRDLRAPGPGRAGALPPAGRPGDGDAALLLRRLAVRLRRAGQAQLEPAASSSPSRSCPPSSSSPRSSRSCTTWASCRSIVRAFALVMSRVMGASGAESLNVAASIFMGQTEAPLTIRPFLPADDPLGADDRDDLGDGPHLRLHHGGVHRLRDRGPAPAHRGDHDRARAPS